MNNKGFTTVELITSFSIASVIMLVLFNVIIIMRDNMSDINSKTNMLVAKDNLSYKINKRLNEKDLTSLTMCEDGDKCYLFTYSDSTTDKLVYNTDSITFNNYTFEITSDITVNEPTVTEHYDSMNSTIYDGYLIINIPISINNKDYSIKTVKHINSENVIIDILKYEYDKSGNHYTIVNYLESTGTQYIDTGVTLPFKVEIRTQFISFQSQQYSIFGLENNRSPWKASYIRIDNTRRFKSNCLSENLVDLGSSDLIIHDYVFSCSSNSSSLIMDGITKTDITISSETISYTNYLFAANSGGTPKHFMNGRIYYAKFYSDVNFNTLVRDYIPVIDSSSRPCLFDKVEKKCYYNQGTGEFLYG